MPDDEIRMKGDDEATELETEEEEELELEEEAEEEEAEEEEEEEEDPAEDELELEDAEEEEEETPKAKRGRPKKKAAAEDDGEEVKEAVFSIPLKSVTIQLLDRRKEDLTDIEELAKSMKTLGQISPIIVQPAKEKGKFKVVAGNRRVAAAKSLGWTEVQAFLRPAADDTKYTLTRLADNIIRKDLSTDKVGEVFQKLLDDGVFESKKELAKAVGMTPANVGHYLVIENEPEVKKLVKEGEIGVGDVAKLGKKRLAKLKGKSSGEVKAALKSDKEKEPRFKNLAGDALVTEDGGPSNLKVGVNATHVRVTVTIGLKRILAGDVKLSEAVAKEIKRVGDKDLGNEIKEFHEQEFSESTAGAEKA